MPWQIEYYEQQNGGQPAEDFEDSLPVKLAGKLARVAVMIEQKGPQAGGGLAEKCHDYPGLWEMRAILQKDLAREFFGFDHRRVVLLSGTLKRAGEPTPAAALRQAYRNWQDYLVHRRISPEIDKDDSISPTIEKPLRKP